MLRKDYIFISFFVNIVLICVFSFIFLSVLCTIRIRTEIVLDISEL